jgi:translation initiation factor 2B subunit (eIF-2B alpha/beta/delta family)
LAGLIKHLAKKGEHVKLIVLESRPMFEGVAFVNMLLSLFRNDSDVLTGLKIDIVSDASIAAVVKSADYFVLGGDKVLPNGDVSNKIGSLTAAVVTKTLNPVCKVVALFGTEKVTSSGFDAEHQSIEYNNEAEVTDAWPFKYINELDKKKEHGFQIEVKNAYFEWVPAKYVDVYVSDIGLLSKEDIARLGQETKELEERIFKDL